MSGGIFRVWQSRILKWFHCILFIQMKIDFDGSVWLVWVVPSIISLATNKSVFWTEQTLSLNKYWRSLMFRCERWISSVSFLGRKYVTVTIYLRISFQYKCWGNNFTICLQTQTSSEGRLSIAISFSTCKKIKTHPLFIKNI